MMDRRHEKATGKYSSREELTIAVKGFTKAGKSKVWVAARTGISHATVSRILRGDKPHDRKTVATKVRDKKLTETLKALWPVRSTNE
jgi:hypothetical protein